MFQIIISKVTALFKSLSSFIVPFLDQAFVEFIGTFLFVAISKTAQAVIVLGIYGEIPYPRLVIAFGSGAGILASNFFSFVIQMDIDLDVGVTILSVLSGRITKACGMAHLLSQILGCLLVIQFILFYCEFNQPGIFDIPHNQSFDEFAQGPARIGATLLDNNTQLHFIFVIEAVIGFFIGILQSAFLKNGKIATGRLPEITFSIVIFVVR